MATKTYKLPATRGATPLAPATPVGPELDSAKLEERHQELRMMAEVNKDVMGWIDAGHAGGGIGMAAFLAAVADRTALQIFKQVKESKTYLGMPYLDEAGKPATCRSLEEYCRFKLGKSYRRLMEILQNERLLGPELYEQAEALKLAQRDYNAIRALPADAQAVIHEALEGATDRKTIVEKLVALAEQQSIEKTALIDERDKAINQYEAREKVVKATQEQITSLKEKLARIPREKPDEKGKAMTIEVAVFATDAAGAVRQLVTGIETLLKHAADNEIDPKPYREAIEHHGAKVIDQIGELIMLLDAADMPTLPARLRTALDVE